MKKISIMNHVVSSLAARLAGAKWKLPMAAACVVGGLASQTVSATPYASGITNDGGTIKFFLNETANSVKVAFDNNSVTNDLSPLGQTNLGVNQFALAGHTNFAIIVSKIGSGVPSQISPTPTAGNSSTNLSYFGPRGVAVNRSPKNGNFGRIYVANASPKITAPSGVDVRQSHKGIYALNPDFTPALGQGTNTLPPKANFPNSGANWWGSSITFSPYKLWVGKDDKLFVGDASAQGVTAGCPLWMMDPNLTTPIQVFSFSGVPNGCGTNAGPVSTTPYVSGSLASGDLTLTCMEFSYATNSRAVPGATYQSVLRYSIGSGPINAANVCAVDPVVLVTNTQPGFGGFPGINAVVSDVAVGTNGYVYVTYPRSLTNGIAGGNNNLWIYDNQVPANLLWASSSPTNGGISLGEAATNDFFVVNGVLTYGVAVSSDGSYLAVGNNGGTTWAFMKLTNGIPDLSTFQRVTAPGNGTRSVAMDLANNVYTVDGNSDSLRVYSLGLSTTCTTYNDITLTNGTFSMVIPPTSVSVSAVSNTASQSGPINGLFTLTRVGQNLNLPLTVNFGLTGSATNYPGAYSLAPAGLIANTNNTITFAANAIATNITVIPTVDAVPRPSIAVKLTLAGGSGYGVGSPGNDTINIINTATPAISVTNLDAQMYERTNDYARFKVTRLGDTNVDLTGAININFGGSATAGTDYYYDSAVVGMAAGVTTTTFKVYPIYNGIYTGNRSVTATVAGGTGYNVATPASTGTVSIVDADLPPETVLWSDSFNTDTSANWFSYFAANNGIDDFRINQLSIGAGAWPFDYSALGIPPAPHTTNGSTLGLYMTVNKDDGTASAAALNFYPVGQSFTGNFALRFDMFLTKNNSSGQTEYAVFGINHSGTKTNWFRNSSGGVPAGSTFDGVFYGLEADGAGLGDYAAFSSPTVANNPTALPAGPAVGGGRNASSLTGVFKAPPWTAGGVPANNYGSTTNTWADVEVSQVNGVITWKINQTEIFSYTNTTAYTGGNIMLGYCDAYDSIGVQGGSIIYDNVRVISLASPVITQITNSQTSVVIKFNGNFGDATNQFVLQSAGVVNGPYIDVTSTIVSPASGTFTATQALNGSIQFYRIKRTY